MEASLASFKELCLRLMVKMKNKIAYNEKNLYKSLKNQMNKNKNEINSKID